MKTRDIFFKGTLAAAFALCLALAAPFAFIACSNSSDSSSATDASGGSSGGGSSSGGTEETRKENEVWSGNAVYYSDEEGVWHSSLGDNAGAWRDTVGWIRIHCAGIQAGDKILITRTGNSYTKYGFQMCGIHSNWSNPFCLYKGTLINAALTDTDSDAPKIKPNADSQTTGYIVTETDAYIINSYGGIAIWGCGYTISKVVIESNTYEKVYVTAKNGMYIGVCGYSNYNKTFMIRLYNPTDSALRDYSSEGTINENVFTSENTTLIVNDDWQQISGALTAKLLRASTQAHADITFTSLPEDLADYLELNTTYGFW